MNPSTLSPLSSSPVVLERTNETTSQLQPSLNQLVQAVSESHLSTTATSSSPPLLTENVNRTIYRIPKESLVYYYCLCHFVPAGKESHYYKLAFPILRTPNKCYLRANLEVETSEPRPSDAQLLINIRNAIEVYKRIAGQEKLIKEELDISTIFKHEKREALKIDLIGNITPLEKGYRVPLRIEFTFGTKIKSRVNQTFWTITLFGIPLLEDILTEKVTADRDQKIAGTQKFKAWEKKVVWYAQYKTMIKEKRPIAIRMSLEEAGLPSDKNDVPATISHSEEQEEATQQPTSSSTRRGTLPTEERPAKRFRSSSASPISDSSDHHAPLSSAVRKVKQVGQFTTQVLQFLESVEDKDKQKDRQIAQLEQQLQEAENKNKETLEAWEKESQRLHQEVDQYKTSAQTAQVALSHLKEMAQPLLQFLSKD